MQDSNVAAPVAAETAKAPKMFDVNTNLRELSRRQRKITRNFENAAKAISKLGIEPTAQAGILETLKNEFLTVNTSLMNGTLPPEEPKVKKVKKAKTEAASTEGANGAGNGEASKSGSKAKK